ncbi:type III secretion system chaperone [Desulfocurvus sp. DL9XJH121]
MDIAGNAQAVLDYVNDAVGGDGLAFDEHGVAALTLDGDIVCFFCLVEDDHELVVTLYLGRVGEGDAPLLYELMCGNYMGAYTGGGTLGIDSEEGLLALHQNFPLPIDEPSWIDQELSSLFGAARYWRDKITAVLVAQDSDIVDGNMLRI